MNVSNQISNSLKQYPSSVIAERMDSIAIIFASIVNFSAYRKLVGPIEATKTLNEILCEFDLLAIDCMIEKIKTNGTMFMAVAGLGSGSSTAAADMARFALALAPRLALVSRKHAFSFEVRAGINTGSVVGGVIGRRKVCGVVLLAFGSLLTQLLLVHFRLVGRCRERRVADGVFKSAGKDSGYPACLRGSQARFHL